ncbi:MAG: undecaprenyl-phosphate glucose phosphotransferase [Pseudomonadota bacterium]
MTLGKISIDEKPALDKRFHDHRFSSANVPDIVACLDVLVVVLSGIGCHVAVVPFRAATFEYYAICIGFIAFGIVVLFGRAGLYKIHAIMRPVGRSDLIIVSVISAFLLFLSLAFSFKVSDIYSRLWMYAFFATALAGLCASRLGVFVALLQLSRRRVVGRTMVVLGTGAQAERFLTRIDTVKPYFTEVAGLFDPDPTRLGQSVAGHEILGDLDDLVEYARSRRVDDIVVAIPWNADEQLSRTIEDLKQLPVNVFISTDLIGYQLQFTPAFGKFSELPMFEVVQRPISGWSHLFKAIEDYVLSALILLILSPLLLLIALAIKLDSPGPIFFMQKRLGFNNKVFEIYKFRSMYHREHPETDIKQAQKHDPRVTRVGRILRRTSLDELPQLLNVLNGTMSLVGPRPHALRHNEDFGRRIRGYFARHKVKPGITGWAQVSGLRGETETIDKMEARVTHDVYYAENWSLMFDLRILFQTAVVVLFQKNAY